MQTKTIPLITTDRLILREHRLEDFPACVKLWTNTTVTRYIGGQARSEEETWSKFLRGVGHWAMLGFGYWVVYEKSTNQFVGEVGFANFKRTIVPAFTDMPEIGWVIDPAFHGQGYAFEAVSAALNWGDQHLPKARTVCLIDPDNSASIRLAQKLGYREFDRADYQGEINILFERLIDIKL